MNLTVMRERFDHLHTGAPVEGEYWAEDQRSDEQAALIEALAQTEEILGALIECAEDFFWTGQDLTDEAQELLDEGAEYAVSLVCSISHNEGASFVSDFAQNSVAKSMLTYDAKWAKGLQTGWWL